MAWFLTVWLADLSEIAQVSPIPGALEPGIWKWTSQNQKLG